MLAPFLPSAPICAPYLYIGVLIALSGKIWGRMDGVCSGGKERIVYSISVIRLRMGILETGMECIGCLHSNDQGDTVFGYEA
jgi:hypothetical protein